MVRRSLGLVIGAALIVGALAPAAHAELMASAVAMPKIPVVSQAWHLVKSFLGKYEDRETYVSYRDAHGHEKSVGPETDRDSALFAGD